MVRGIRALRARSQDANPRPDVDSTEGAATGDQEQADAAVEDLLGYTETLAAVFEDVTEGELPAEASQPGIEMHVTTLKDVVDARIDEDFDATFAGLREAAGHMDNLSEALAGAQDQPNVLLSEHVWLAGAATGNALVGNDAAFGAAATQLTEGNSADLAALVGQFYGEDTEAVFLDCGTGTSRCSSTTPSASPRTTRRRRSRPSTSCSATSTPSRRSSRTSPRASCPRRTPPR